MRITRFTSVFAAAALCGVFSISAGEVLSTGDEAGLEKWGVAAVYHAAEVEPSVDVGNGSAIQVPTSGGAATVFSQSNTQVSLTQKSEALGVSFTFRPKRLRYTISVSDVRWFDLAFSSGSSTNRFRGDDGYRIGLGVSGSFVPLSVASLGIGWSLDYRRTDVSLDEFSSAEGLTPAGHSFIQDEIQAAVTAGYKIKSFLPYAGLKLQRWVTRLTDDGSKQAVRGEEDGISPLVGVEWSPFDGEGVQLEASFADEKSFTASLFFKI